MLLWRGKSTYPGLFRFPQPPLCVVAPAMAAYAEGLGRPAPSLTAAILATADQNPAPLRLMTGSDAFNAMLTALRQRPEAQKDLAFSTDARAAPRA
ncbi:hypothetical protein ACJMQP_27050 (plasmid) [Rhodopseudomonas palustris]